MSGMLGTVVQGNPSFVRMFLRADTAEKLVRLQLLTNVRLGGQANYTDIQFADGFWYAWFLVDIEKFPEMLNGSESSTG